MDSNIEFSLTIINIVIALFVFTCIYKWYLMKKDKKLVNKYVENFEDLINVKTPKIIINTNMEHIEHDVKNIKMMETRVDDKNRKIIRSFKYLNVFYHKPMNGYYPLGQTMIYTKQKYDMIMDQEKIKRLLDTTLSLSMLADTKVFPIDYKLKYQYQTEKDTFTIWNPIPPKGYVVFSDILVQGNQKPFKDKIVCLPKNTNIETINSDNYGNMIKSIDDIMNCYSVTDYNYIKCEQEDPNSQTQAYTLDSTYFRDNVSNEQDEINRINISS